jgi:GNAT superfamily N-acetyltransferase
MRVLPFTADDIPRLPELQPPGWSDITPMFRQYLSSGLYLPVTIGDGTGMVAVGCAICFGRTAWLAHIIVHPDHRRKGAASLLMEHLLGVLNDRGVMTISLIATNEGYPLYRRFGFADEAQYVFFENEGEPGPAGVGGAVAVDEEIESATDATTGDHEAIVALDREVSGEDRAPLLLPHLPDAKVVRDAGRVTGVCYPALGEGFIEALVPAAGLQLLAHRLRTHDRRTHSRCVVPSANTAAMGYLNERGFRELFRVWRMSRGPAIGWRPECIYSRIAGSLG